MHGATRFRSFAFAAFAVLACTWAHPALSEDVPGGPPVWQGVRFPANWRLWPGPVIAVPPSKTGTTYYVDGKHGDDGNSGTSLSDPLKTIGAAVRRVRAGDTVLIRKGLYKESPLIARSGTDGNPITFGSYGDGEVIVDGSPAIPAGSWVRESGTVWKIVGLQYTPVAVVVNDVPLREVSHGQTKRIPRQGVLIPASGSGQWYYAADRGVLYADFGAVLAHGGNPNDADIMVPRNGRADRGAFRSTISYMADYLTFAGLTVRGGTYDGISGCGSHITVVACQIKFNTRAGVVFVPNSPRTATVGDRALYNLVHDNVLENWPRGNNGFVWGGWPMHFGAYACYQCLFQGNIVYHGGGEGILNYGSKPGVETGSNVVRRNIVYDNWSTEIYFDNQPNDVAEDNFIFSHPKASVQGDLLGYWAKGARLLNAPGISLADESNSGPGAALADSRVTGNVVINSFNAIDDGCEGRRACMSHALINTTISHNTIVLPPYAFSDSNDFGFHIHEGLAGDRGSEMEWNLVCGVGKPKDVLFFFDDPRLRIPVLSIVESGRKIEGVTIDHNRYFLRDGKGGFSYGTWNIVGFAAWRNKTGQDRNSVFSHTDGCNDVTFDATPSEAPVFDPRRIFGARNLRSDFGARWVWEMR